MASPDGSPSAGLVVAVALFPSVVRALTGDDIAKTAYHASYAVFGLARSAVVVGLLRGCMRAAAWISSPLLRQVGVVSFGIYLWHEPILRGLVMLRLAHPALTTWLTIGASIALGMLSYLLIERPFVHGALAKRRVGRAR